MLRRTQVKASPMATPTRCMTGKTSAIHSPTHRGLLLAPRRQEGMDTPPIGNGNYRYPSP